MQTEWIQRVEPSMPPVGPVPPAGLMMTQGMGPIPIDPNLTPEQWASMQPTEGPMAPVATPQKPVAQNPLVDPRMYRSYQENIQLMGDPRMRPPMGGMPIGVMPPLSNEFTSDPDAGLSGQEYAEKHNIPYAKGGRVSYTKGGLAKILGV